MQMLENLREKIDAAWADMPSPQRDEIVLSHIGDFATCFDFFFGKKWEYIHFEEVMNHRDCVTFLSEKALLYFLPAFMTASIEEQQIPMQWDITEYTIKGIGRLLKASAVAINRCQRGAIKDYLELLSGRELAQEARTSVLSTLKLLEQ